MMNPYGTAARITTGSTIVIAADFVAAIAAELAFIAGAGVGVEPISP